MKIVKSSFILSVLGLSMVGCFGQETKTSQNTQRDQSQNVFPFICNEPVQNSENPFLSALTHPATLTLGAVATLWGASKLAYEVSDTVKGKIHQPKWNNLLWALKPWDSIQAKRLDKTNPGIFKAFQDGPEAYRAFQEGPEAYKVYRAYGQQTMLFWVQHVKGDLKASAIFNAAEKNNINPQVATQDWMSAGRNEKTLEDARDLLMQDYMGIDLEALNNM